MITFFEESPYKLSFICDCHWVGGQIQVIYISGQLTIEPELTGFSGGFPY